MFESLIAAWSKTGPPALKVVHNSPQPTLIAYAAIGLDRQKTQFYCLFHTKCSEKLLFIQLGKPVA